MISIYNSWFSCFCLPDVGISGVHPTPGLDIPFLENRREIFLQGVTYSYKIKNIFEAYYKLIFDLFPEF